MSREAAVSAAVRGLLLRQIAPMRRTGAGFANGRTTTPRAVA
jgi:hypothetical protein